jgi:histidinol-phosphate aminotransferase
MNNGMNMSFSVPIRKNLQSLTPYVPGKPIEEVERELGISNVSKIASNENPLGPSPKVLQAVLKAFEKIHRYPDGSAHHLTRALADHLGVGKDRLILGNGSNEILVRLGQMVLLPGDEVIFADPSFVVYPATAQLFDAVAKPVPLKNFTHDLKAFERALTPKTRLVFIANPNNPTGTIVSLAEVEGFLKACPPQVLVALDEAYYDYVDDKSYFESLALTAKYPNLVVLRTFSKAFGLAGLRVGYAVAHPEIAETFQKIREPFNVNALAQAAAEAALSDLAHVKKVVSLNAAMRKKLFDGLSRLGLAPAPSQANFVFFKIPKAMDLYNRLLLRGVIVRPMGSDSLRVTTGTEAETGKFLEYFGEIATPKGVATGK